MSGLRLVEGGLGAQGTDPDLEAHMAWARDLRGYTPATLHARRWVLERMARHVAVPLREVTEAHLVSWERAYVAGLAAQSRRAYIGHVSAFYKWLLQTKVISENPADMLTRPKMPKPLPRPISEADLRRALAKANPKIGAMITLMAYSGLRAMEVANLQWQDMSTTADGRAVLHVRNGKGSKDRALPVGKVVLEALRVYGVRRRGSMFLGRDGHQMLSNSVSQVVNQYLRRQGITSTAHKLRHRFATVSAPLLDNDLPLLAALCGWNSLETAKHYVLPDPERSHRLVAALDELAVGPQERPGRQPETAGKRRAATA